MKPARRNRSGEEKQRGNVCDLESTALMCEFLAIVLLTLTTNRPVDH